MEIIGEGAEAQIEIVSKDVLRKVRVSKGYRVSALDNKLRRFRNKREFKVLSKLYEEGVNCPKVFDINEDEFFFTFEYVCGDLLKEVLDYELLNEAFSGIVKMHNCGVVHNDLTTLNMIVKSGRVFLIDFGLSDFSVRIEDRAVDLNLFFSCIRNEHNDFYRFKEELLSMYSKSVHSGERVVKRLFEIEKRGRNK